MTNDITIGLLFCQTLIIMYNLIINQNKNKSRTYEYCKIRQNQVDQH